MSVRFLTYTLGFFALTRTCYGALTYRPLIPWGKSSAEIQKYACIAGIEALGINPSYDNGSIIGKLDQKFTDANSWFGHGFNATAGATRVRFDSASFNGYRSGRACSGACQWCFNQAAGLGAVTAGCGHFPKGDIDDLGAVRCAADYAAIDQYFSLSFAPPVDLNTTGSVVAFQVTDPGTNTVAQCSFLAVQPAPLPGEAPTESLYCEPSTFYVTVPRTGSYIPDFNISHIVQVDGEVVIKTATVIWLPTGNPEEKVGVRFVSANATSGIAGDPLIPFINN